MKYLLLVVLVLLFNLDVLSQGQGNTWIFGDSAGVHFVNGQPISINSSILGVKEMSASISDQQGNLLFYCGPSAFSASWDCCAYVWDRNNQLMPNGSNLNSGGTITQGSLIIPMPGDTMKYYIFNINGLDYNLYYSMVDLSLNGGFGDVTIKNIHLCDTVITEKMIGIKHANGRDWWVITHQYNSNKFYNYVVTPYSINGPYIQSIGDSITADGYAGQMAVNKDGTEIILAGVNGDLQFYDFDRCSGLLSNFLQLGDPVDSMHVSYGGCSFSPEGSVLYASTIDTLFQFDLTAINIKASKNLIAGYLGGMPGDILIGQHQISPDSKIYIALSSHSLFSCDSLVTHLSVINNPDILGIGCNFSPISFPLINCSEVYFGLPNMPNYNLSSLVGSVCDTVTAVEDIRNNYSINIFPNPVTNQLNIKTSNVQLSEITLYDIASRKLLQQTFSSSTSLNTSQLAKGIYLYQITNKNGIVKTGKVVKE